VALYVQRNCREPVKVTPEVDQHLLDYLDGVPQDYGRDRVNWTLELPSRQLGATPTLNSPAATSSCCCVAGAVVAWAATCGPSYTGARATQDTVANRQAGRAVSPEEEEVLYQDEAEAHLDPKVGPTNLTPGHQPMALTPGKNIKRYVFGALDARTGRILYGIARSETAELFAADSRAVPVVPNALFQIS